MTSPSNSAVQNLLPVQAYFNADGSFNTFIGQGVPFYATSNPIQSGLTITNSTLDSSPIGSTTPSTGIFTNIATTTGTISTQPTGATDIVNLLALQSYAAGISWKQPCAVATLSNITLSGLQTIDSYTTLVGDRVLVKNQSSAANNGIYLAASGTWTRALDADVWQEFVSAITFIEYGTQAGGAWFCTATPGGTLGVTPLNWSQFTTSATYSAGTGLTLIGSVFSITNTGVPASTYGSATATPVFAVNAQGQITSVTNTTITPAIGNVTGLGTNMLAFLQTPTSANLAATVTDETGSGALVFANSPTFITPALGTPASGVVTNLTGTASININGSVGATTANTGAFTYISTSSSTNTTPTLGFNASNSPLAMGATISGSYLQAILQNKSGTAGASTNYVLSNDLGTDSTYYGEFGMNSSVFSASTPADFFSINNGVYFSSHDGDVSVGSGNGGKHYLVWGTVGQSAHVINAAGAIGLSTNLGTTPAGSGTSGFGTSGQVLTSAGNAAAPTWTTPSPMVYPGSGIPNSTGSAWGTSYSTTGSGTVVALATSPTFVTPALGVATGTSVQVTGGFYSSSSSSFTYTDGIVVDYITGTGRFSVGTADGFAWYNAGVATTSLMTLSSAGALAATSFAGAGTGLTGTATSLSIGGNAATATSATSATSATTATNATNTAITDDTTTATSVYPTWVTTTTGNLPQKTASTKLSFVPSTGRLTATSFAGDGSALTGISGNLTVGTTAVGSGTSGYILYNNGGTLGNLANTGSGNNVLATSPTLATPAVTGGIALNGSTSGAVTLIAPAVAGTPTMTFKAPTQTNLTSGSGTYTVPTGAVWLKIIMVGGGGGGGGNGASNTDGSTGGTTTFNSINAVGGSGGQRGAAGNGTIGGLGGTGGTGTAQYRSPGQYGGTGPVGWTNAAYATTSGGGGSSALGAGGINATQGTVAGVNAAANSGGGGSGGGGVYGSTNSSSGGGGGEFVELLIGSPAASYSYAVGAGGSGGTGSGGNAATGGNGGSGVIIIEEHYVY